MWGARARKWVGRQPHKHTLSAHTHTLLRAPSIDCILKEDPRRLGQIGRFAKQAVAAGDAMGALAACRDMYQPRRPPKIEPGSSVGTEAPCKKPARPLVTHVTDARKLTKAGGNRRFSRDTNNEGLSAEELAAGHAALSTKRTGQLSPFKGKGKQAGVHNMAVAVNNNAKVRYALPCRLLTRVLLAMRAMH